MSVGKKFTDFSLTSLEDGKKTKLSKIAGKGTVTVVVIYATSAPESAHALQAAEEFAFSKKSHVRFLLVNVEDKKKVALNYLQEQNIRSCEGYTAKMPKGYDIREGAYPYHIIIDEAGKILEASEDTVNYSTFIA